VIRIYVENLGFNLNYFEVKSSNITAIGNPHLSNIKVFPNPSKNGFSIESGSENIDEIRLFDLNGKLILSKNYHDKRVELGSNLNTGIYLLSVFKEDEIEHFKLIKE
jgi:hypothetical protein